MKLSAFFLLAAVLHAGAAGFAQQVTLHEKGVSLGKVLQQLHGQTGYDFIYTDDQLRSSRSVDIDVSAAGLLDVLRLVFRDQALSFIVDEHTVVLRDKPLVAGAAVVDTAGHSEITVSGMVSDLRFGPLNGADIVVKNHKGGGGATTSDVRGLFELRGLSERDSLVVSFIGYKTKTVPVARPKGTGLLYIRLEITDNTLDQAVVQGYGRTSQRLTTADIGRLSAAEIAKQPVSDPLLALEGRVAGVVVTPQTGYEGGPIKVEIRGRNAIDSRFPTDPLYVIDGVPLTILDVNGTSTSVNSVTNISPGLDQTGLSPSGGQSPLYMINPADIESIEILKDAAATAIYGSRGGNGVILITTKKGKAGPVELSLNVSEGVSTATRGLSLLKTPQYLAYRRMQFANDGILPTYLNAPDLAVWDTTRYTDWFKYSYGKAGQNTRLNGSLSGGNDQTVYRIGVGYDQVADITTRAGVNQRVSISTSFSSTSPNKKFKTTLTAGYTYAFINQLNVSLTDNLPPDAPPVFDSVGKLNWLPYHNAGMYMPFTGLFMPYASKDGSLNANLNLEYNVVKGLSAKVSVGYNNNQNYQTAFTPIASEDPNQPSPPTGSSSFGNTHANNWIVEPQISYHTVFGKHKLDFLAGGTVQNSETEGMRVNGSGYTSDVFIKSIELAPIVTSTDNYSQYKYAGVFSRVSYNYDNKYIVDLNARRDGSSRFGPGKQFGNFGAVSGAWIASDEPFVRAFLPKAFSFLKIHGSYGLIGSDAIGDYAYLSQWSTIGGQPSIFNPGTTILLPTIEPNPDFHWQVSKNVEGGIQMGWLDSRLNLGLAYYRNRCGNQLLSYPLGEFTGFTSVVANRAATLQNSGFEATLSGTVVRTRGFSWGLSFNVAVNRNKLVSYPGLALSPYASTLKVGQSANVQYLLHYTGLDPLTGLPTFKDYNHDGRVYYDQSIPAGTGDDDRYIKVDQEPTYTGGFGSNFSYKTLSLSFFFTFVKQMGLNPIIGSSSSLANGLTNITAYQNEHLWTHPGQTDALYQKATTFGNATGNMVTSDADWANASYVRLGNCAFSYTMPQHLAEKAGLKGLAFNIRTYNLFVISPYRGVDPEMRNLDDHPPAKQIDCGLSFSF